MTSSTKASKNSSLLGYHPSRLETYRQRIPTPASLYNQKLPPLKPLKNLQTLRPEERVFLEAVRAFLGI